jgi:hypothetical protein
MFNNELIIYKQELSRCEESANSLIGLSQMSKKRLWESYESLRRLSNDYNKPIPVDIKERTYILMYGKKE